ncbi:uncharacterized protein LOC120345204 [Styela clava]
MFLNKRQKLPQPAVDPKTKSLPKSYQKKTPDAKWPSQAPKSATVKESKKPLDWDDISLSSDDSKSFQRFLKKDSEDTEQEEGHKQEKPSKNAVKIESFERPKTSRGSLDRQISDVKPHISSSNALNRLALIEARFKDRQIDHSQNILAMSSSDFDLDVSSDLDVKRQIGKSKIKLRETVKKSQKSKSATLSNRLNILTVGEETDTSEEDGIEKMRFIKGNPNVEFSDDSQKLDLDARLDYNKEKLRASSEFDDSDSALADKNRYFVKRSGSPKRVTFASDLVRSSDLEQSYDEFISMSEKSEEPVSLDEILPTKLHNIMSLDDLLPSRDSIDEDDNDRPTSALGFAGLHSVEELIPSGKDSEVRSSNEFASSMEEDIQGMSVNSDDISSNIEGNLQNLRSIDELEIGPLESKDGKIEIKSKPANIFKPETSIHDSESEEIKSESIKYSEDFHSSDDDTLKDTESITQDIAQSVSSIPSSVPDKDSLQDKTASYSSSFNSTRTSSSSTISTRTPTPRKKKLKPKKSQTTETQTDIASGVWVPGSVFAAKPFTPTKLIKNEALDVLSSYNPATLALQDILQQQVTITREFIARSRRLHELATSAIPCDYVYGNINEESLARLKNIWYAQENLTVSPK